MMYSNDIRSNNTHGSNTTTSTATIEDTTTYQQLYRGRPFNTICSEQNCIMFQTKFKEIFDVGRKHRLQDGETLQLIKKATNGRFLDEVPWIELNEVKRFVEINAPIALNYTNPVLYGTLKHIGYYSMSKHQMATANEIQGFSNRLTGLFNAKASYKYFYDLAKSLIN